jgi:hypothetical protein
MPTDYRRCTKCAVVKPLSEFSKAPRGLYGVKANCKACDAARNAALVAANPPPVRTEDEKREAYTKYQHDDKTCTKCGVTKPRAGFGKAREGKYGAVLKSICKRCQSDQAMQWYRDNPGRTEANKRKFNLQKFYGLTIAQYNAMEREQAGVCAICRKGEPNAHGRTGRQFRLSVDHCHDTGVVRGLLCQKCNRAVGLLGDDPIIMRRAISYLLRSQKGAVHQGGQ